MTANVGRTHGKFVQVYLDDSGGTLTDVTAGINNIGTVGLTSETQDVTNWSDGSHNIVIGQPSAPLTIGGAWNTVIHTHMTGISGLSTPLSLDIRVGVRHAWESGEPQFGITSSASSGYLCSGYTVDFGANTWSATLDVYGATAPAFGTSAET